MVAEQVDSAQNPAFFRYAALLTGAIAVIIGAAFAAFAIISMLLGLVFSHL